VNSVKIDTEYRPINPVASFVNDLGETRIIHRPRGKTQASLRLLKETDTVSHRLNRAAAVLVGQRIKARRIEAGMTLEQLGVRAGLTGNPVKVYVFSIEKAARRQGIRFGTLYAIALALGCSISDLMPTPEEVQAAAGVSLQATLALGSRP
jgi:DNA-binding Xre family transcriptional regulator